MTSLKAKECGHVSAAHGVKGGLKVLLEQHIDLQKGTWCFLEFQKKPVPFFMEECSVSDDVAILKLRGVETPEQATALRGKTFMLEENLAQSKGLLSDQDLGYVGFEVFLIEGQLVGEVTNVYDNSGQTLLEVKGKEMYLIPFHEDWLEEVDLGRKRLTLEVPEGLLSL